MKARGQCQECQKKATHKCKDCGNLYCTDCAEFYDLEDECDTWGELILIFKPGKKKKMKVLRLTDKDETWQDMLNRNFNQGKCL